MKTKGFPFVVRMPGIEFLCVVIAFLYCQNVYGYLCTNLNPTNSVGREAWRESGLLEFDLLLYFHSRIYHLPYYQNGCAHHVHALSGNSILERKYVCLARDLAG